MTTLAIAPTDGSRAAFETREPVELATRLAAVDVVYERWLPAIPLRDNADSDEILAAFAPDVARLDRAWRFHLLDVVRAPGVEPVGEHTHPEPELRCFVSGGARYTFRVGPLTYTLTVSGGDMVGLPAGLPHALRPGVRHPVILRMFPASPRSA